MRLIPIITLTLLVFACTSPKEDKSTQETEPINKSQTFETNDTLHVIASGDLMSDIKFSVDTIIVQSDKSLTISLENQSTMEAMPHNLVIIKSGTANDVGQGGLKFKDNGYVNPEDANVIAHSPLAQIGETVLFSFHAPAPGNYEFICSFPGHWGLMKGVLIVAD